MLIFIFSHDEGFILYESMPSHMLLLARAFSQARRHGDYAFTKSISARLLCTSHRNSSLETPIASHESSSRRRRRRAKEDAKILPNGQKMRALHLAEHRRRRHLPPHSHDDIKQHTPFAHALTPSVILLGMPMMKIRQLAQKGQLVADTYDKEAARRFAALTHYDGRRYHRLMF